MRIRAVSLNETMHYNIREEDKPYIKEIRASYFYNPDERTYCCEVTPSYDLRYLHSYVIFQDDPSDEKRDELEEYYCSPGYDDDPDMYVHCRLIDRDIVEKKDCGEFESMEEALEYLQGNWPF